MKFTKNSGTAIGAVKSDLMVENKNVFSDNNKVVCKHCGKAIAKTRLIGLSLICQSCKKPQNGTHLLKLV